MDIQFLYYFHQYFLLFLLAGLVFAVFFFYAVRGAARGFKEEWRKKGQKR